MPIFIIYSKVYIIVSLLQIVKIEISSTKIIGVLVSSKPFIQVNFALNMNLIKEHCLVIINSIRYNNTNYYGIVSFKIIVFIKGVEERKSEDVVG